MNQRKILFIALSFVIFILFYGPLKDLVSVSLKYGMYSHVMLIPLISGYFIFTGRKEIFSEKQYSFGAGIAMMAVGSLLYLIGKQQAGLLNKNDYLSLMIFSAWIIWIGGFVFFYGVKASQIALFPLLFLLFMVPIPTKAMETIISLLQIGSAEAAYGLFKLTGVPILREGFTFNLPGMSIEVAKQCSGIRSSIALFITAVLAGQLFLRTGWKKWILALSIFPIAIFKNGVRIVTLSLLGTYVDSRILGSELHKSGGIPFFIVALVLLAPVLWVLRKSETLEIVEGTNLKSKGEV